MRTYPVLLLTIAIGLLCASCRVPDPASGPPPRTAEIVPADGNVPVDSSAAPEISTAAAQQVQPSAHRFERADDWKARLDDPARDAWQRPQTVVALMEISPGMTVADLGTGTGYFLPWLSRSVGETGSVLALDCEADMIRHCDERAEEEELFNVRTRVIPPDDPALPPEGVHRVLIVNTWHHIARRPEYAAKMARGLAPGGRIYIVEVTPESPVGPPRAERLSPEAVVDAMRAGGLSAEILPEDLPHQYVVVARNAQR